MDRDATRAARQHRTYLDILSGKTPLTPHLGPIFLQAFSSQTNPVDCVTKLVGSKAGLSALQSAIRYDLSPKFLNSFGSAILRYLQNDQLAVINNGLFLSDLLLKLVNPPTFWIELRKAFLNGDLDEAATHSFGWLLLRLCMSPSDDDAISFRLDNDMPTILNKLLSSASRDTVTVAQKLDEVLNTVQIINSTVIDSHATINGPGGRHDNDFVDFHKISILPTAEELQSIRQSFLRPASVLEDPATEPSRVAIHLDNQFRLLREDMLSELREEILIAMNKKKGFHRGSKVTGLAVINIDFEAKRPSDWGLVCRCTADFPQMKGLTSQQQRRDFLEQKRNFFKHQSLACLLAGDQFIGFATINRNEERLSKSPPEIVLQFSEAESTRKALYGLKSRTDLSLVQIDTALFGYEPILKGLQQAKTLPMSFELLLWKKGDVLDEVSEQAVPVVRALELDPCINLKRILSLSKDIVLDASQSASLLCGLTKKVSLIQGPPGTGKSFIGALLAKAIHDYTPQRILVVCYTNHALDDVLTSLLDIGIPESAMVRLGGKSTQRTEPLALRNQNRAGLNQADYNIVDDLKSQITPLINVTTAAFKRYNSSKIPLLEILDYLEIEDPTFFEAFCVPELDNDMQVVGQDGKAIGPEYLIDRWSRNIDAGSFKQNVFHVTDEGGEKVWTYNNSKRKACLDRWKDKLLLEAIDELCDNAQEYNRCQMRLSQAFGSGRVAVLRNKRVLGCTTTAAAMYREEIQAFNPQVLLVEEAGEILESHVLMSLGLETSQMILIGDHKQLRPKVNNYLLTVEKGEGYDLNRSLFERLIMKEYPHQTLSQQHRMRPEISALIRHLTYPELTDAPKTQDRPDLRGVRDNIVFINHENPEDENKLLADTIDGGSKTSKQNSFEIFMILKIVKYLAQQGYGTDKLVILTPYLGQLQKLRSILKDEADPILNDLDSAELIRAGLMNPGEAKVKKNPIHLATIDNYQGEESDIVIVSLTRSNPKCDIGFMFSPERLNVLLSRARNALIMIGNANTFKNARKGGELWRSLFTLLGDGKHIYDGLPVVCQQHPDQKSILKTVGDFEEICPDGGCAHPCGAKLICGHECPSKCHMFKDHSRVNCMEMQSSTCQSHHLQVWHCSRGPPKDCGKCTRLKDMVRKKKQEDLLEKARQEAEQKAHLARLDKLDMEMQAMRKAQEEALVTLQRENAIKQKEADLAALRARGVMTPGPASTPVVGSKPNHPAANIGTPSGLPQPNSIPTTITVQPLRTNTTSPSSSQPQARSDENSSSPASSLLGKIWNSVAAPFQQPAVPMKNIKNGGKPFVPLKPSKSVQEWQCMKNIDGAVSSTIDDIMAMTGLETIKEEVLKIKAKIDIAQRQNASMKKERFNAVLLGNPGTGKTTVARHYCKFLAEVGAIPGNTFIETTGASLANEGVDAAKKLVEKAVASHGGAIFIDEAYQLTNGNSSGGAAVLDFLLAEMENNVGTLIFILAGYRKEMEKFFEHNPGLKSRVPYQFQFVDYKDEELMAMFQATIHKTFSGSMKVEEGVDGLYCRIAIRRLGRRRSTPGFGNARDLEEVFAKIRGRQAIRLAKARREGTSADDFYMTQEDIIGPDPAIALQNSDAWKQLQSLIGLGSVKKSVQSLLSLIGENYQRELIEKEPMEVSLNRVFLGSPGTGKTTVAKLYGQILAELGLLTNGEVVVKNPADFIGAHLGESETKTKGILANTVGKVLIIDEAYMLYGGGAKNGQGGNSSSNQFKTSVIDTIVAEVQSVPGEDRCVLLLGYKDQMVEMFENVNPGLSRRFKIEDSFKFEDFSNDELLKILNLKLKQSDLDATDAAKKVALEMLIRMRNRPNFGNGGDVENIISQAKERCVQRRSQLPTSERPLDVVFEPQDFDPDFNRGATATANLAKLFEDIVGCESIVNRLKGYQDLALMCRQTDRDPLTLIPMNFVFTGPPGTGKTTVARKMGQVFYDMGILGSGDVEECSASDLVGEYVGHTGPKTKKLFEKALGKVLFIDEAYRLSQGHFAQEAIDELVGLLTHPSFKSKLIVILAGYEDDINKLMSVNSGLSSRFPDQIFFHNMDPDCCIDILTKELVKNKIVIGNDFTDKTSPLYNEMKELVLDLSELRDWGNARDMITLSKALMSQALLSSVNQPGGVPTLTSNDTLNVFKTMVQDRKRRAKVSSKPRPPPAHLPVQSATPIPPTPPPVNTATSTSPSAPPPASPSSPQANSRRPQQDGRGPVPRANRGRNRGRGVVHQQSNVRQPSESPRTPTTPNQSYMGGDGAVMRDPGVSDAVWKQLNEAKRAQAALAERARQEQLAAERRAAEQRRIADEQRRLRLEKERALAAERDAARRAALEREREAARRAEQAAQAARRRAEEERKARQEAERRRLETEQRAQQRLRQMGVCPAGFQWVNMGSYYRCRGGSHTVPTSSLGL